MELRVQVDGWGQICITTSGYDFKSEIVYDLNLIVTLTLTLLYIGCLMLHLVAL